MKNKKGFTLVELLVAIVILGVLSAIAMVSIYKILQSSEKNYYEKQENLLVLAGKDYFTSNRNRLPKTIGLTEKVDLGTLIGQKYIDPVLDRKKQACFGDKSYVSVKKKGSTQYQYQVYLECPNYKGTPIPEEQNGNNNITFVKNSETSKTAITVTMKITGDNIASYKYRIINKTTGATNDSANKSYNGDVTIKLQNEGKYQLVGYAYDNKGQLTEKTSGFYIIDKTAPNCGSAIGMSTSWSNKDRNISVMCEDGLSGCKKEKYDQLFNQTMKTGAIKIEDNVGNERICNVNVYVDKDKPSCGAVTGASTTWTKGNRTISVACSDSMSGCSAASVSKPYSASQKTDDLTITDKAGNTNTCPVDVYIDKDAPSCGTVTGASTTWTKNDRTLSVACSDSMSGCSAASVSKKYSSSKKTDTLTISDKVGNTRDCSVNVYVDKDAPNCGSVTGASTTWTKNDRTISVACSDSMSDCSAASVSKKYSSSKKTDTLTISDKVGNTRDCNVNVYVDKDKPSCGTVTGASKTWTKNDRTIKVACSDSLSGCSASSTSKKYTATTTTANISISDKAGNSRDCAVNVYIDKTPPAISVDMQTNYKYESSKQYCVDRPNTTYPKVVALLLSDPHSGLKDGTMYFKETTTNWKTINQTYGKATNYGVALCGFGGTYTWSVCDAVGNCRNGSK